MDDTGKFNCPVCHSIDTGTTGVETITDYCNKCGWVNSYPA